MKVMKVPGKTGCCGRWPCGGGSAGISAAEGVPGSPVGAWSCGRGRGAGSSLADNLVTNYAGTMKMSYF